MQKSFAMNRMIVGGNSGGGSIRLMHAAELPAAITPRAICAITDEAVSGMLMMPIAPEHASGLIWIEIVNVAEPELIGADGEEAVELIQAWISTGDDWAPLEAHHSATGEWVQFSLPILPLPEFSYTGDSELIDDGEGNWRIKFLTSGILILEDNRNIDVFLVGGGGGGTYSGGGGGYTNTFFSEKIQKSVAIPIIVGAGGNKYIYGAQSPTDGGYSEFGPSMRAEGGKKAEAGQIGSPAGHGGSGGGSYSELTSATNVGGSDGSNGVKGSLSYVAGTGQGTTTREFGETTGDLYSGGGGGGNFATSPSAKGGDGGGGRGNGSNSGASSAHYGIDGIANKGGGAGGGSQSATGRSGNGGSGIVIIRNAR